ncbi:IS110 family RNA-guided transposase [Petrotoga mobilis]
MFKKYPMTKKGIEEFKKNLDKETEVAVEATGNSRFFYNSIVSQVKKVRVINSSQFKVISESVKKTDRHDAEIIAEYLSKGLLPEVRVMSKENRELKSLIQTRNKLVKLRSTLKNKIHGILMEYGITTRREMFSSEKALEEVRNAAVSETSRFEIGVIVDQIKSLNEGIKKIEEKIKGNGEGLKGQKNLRSITRIGKLSSTIILSNIGDINDFDNSKKLCAYAELVPRVYDSNESIRHGRITKRGDKILRTTLVQVALIAIRYSPYIRGFYERLKHKKGSGKAIIATARKMLSIIYETLKNDWVFEDFNNFILA